MMSVALSMDKSVVIRRSAYAHIGLTVNFLSEDASFSGCGGGISANFADTTLIEDGGRILNVSSGFVRFTLPGYSVYAA